MSTTTGGRSLRSRVAAALAAAGALVMASGLVVLNASSATARGDKTVHKSYVCKYVGTPGVEERLQTGQNPIWVDNHSLTGSPEVTYVGEAFSDAHGRSVVIVANTAKLDPEPSVADCPTVKPPPSTSPSTSPSSRGTVHKSYVCKYVGTPGVDERLQTGQNPIWVDNHSLTGSPEVTYVGEEFSDAQGRSVVIVANTPKLDPEPSVADCPVVTPSSSPSVSPSESMSPSVSPSESVSPSSSPSVSPSESESPSTPPSVSPSESESPSTSPSVSPSESVSPSQPVSSSPSVAGTETVRPRPGHHPVSQPTVLGTQAVAPTAVEAGLSTWPPRQPASPTGTFVGAGLLGGGLLLLVSGGWLGLGGRKRGAHQA